MRHLWLGPKEVYSLDGQGFRNPRLVLETFRGQRVGDSIAGRLDLQNLGAPLLFRDIPDLSGDGPKIFPICPCPLSRPKNCLNSTYEEQSRRGPRHNPDLSQKKWETPRFGNPPVQLLSTLFALNLLQSPLEQSAPDKSGQVRGGSISF